MSGVKGRNRCPIHCSHQGFLNHQSLQRSVNGLSRNICLPTGLQLPARRSLIRSPPWTLALFSLLIHWHPEFNGCCSFCVAEGMNGCFLPGTPPSPAVSPFLGSLRASATQQGLTTERRNRGDFRCQFSCLSGCNQECLWGL